MVAPVDVLAVVPARGGSKGLPGKNIRLLAGRPLIAYSIAAGLQSECVTRVIVSTDSPEIADVALRCGAEVPFLRPAELAGDTTRDFPVFLHAIETLRETEGYRPQAVVQLRPTSPLRPPGAVDEAVRRLLDTPHADCVRSVTPSGENPYKMWRMDGNRIVPLIDSTFDEPYNMPRQELPPTFWQTGHIDVFRTTTVTEKHSLSGEMILPILIDRQYAVDIDTLSQWEMAEWLLAHHRPEIVWPEAAPQ